MKRYRVTGRFTVEVRAKDEGDAEDQVHDLAHNLDLRLVDVEDLSPPEPPGPYPVPAGVGAWGPHLESIRLAEDDKRHVGEWDGAWWWGNGHMLLRCPGPCVPENGGGVQVVVSIPRLVTERTQAEWVDGTGDDAKAYRSGSGRGTVGISRVYRALVEAGAPGCSWWVGHRHDPILAKDSDGRTVAIVMPMTVSP